MSTRERYIDHLRTAMTGLVIFAHSAITYGGLGDWFYVETRHSRSHSALLLTLFVSTCSTCMMGCFFLLAGYFTPVSLKRKGYRRFVLDRFLRLGLPLLLFGVIVAPLTISLAAHAAGYSFRETLVGGLDSLLHGRQFHTGPMWFAWELMIFSLVYCALIAMRDRNAAGAKQRQAEQVERPLPSTGVILGSALAVGAVSLLVRQVFPIYARFAGVWPAALPIYVFLFAVGMMAWRRDWLGQPALRPMLPIVIVAALAWPVLPLTILFILRDAPVGTVRGMSPTNVILSFWEPIVSFGSLAALLLLFRRFWNNETRAWKWLGRRAYAVYFIHPLILVAVCWGLRRLALPPLGKFVVAGCLGCVASWLAADLLLRLPGLKRIL